MEGSHPGAFEPPPSRGDGRFERWLPLVVVVPVLVSLISALVQRWVVIGDGAAIMVRARDVTRGHIPTLGMPTSLPDIVGGPPSYHPGPMLFLVLAPFAWLLGPTVGAAVGTAVIQGASLAGCVAVARRAGRRIVTIGAAITGLSLAVTVFGPGHFFDPLNSFLPAIPLLLLYLCCWRLFCGDSAPLALAIGVGSFCVQAHVSFAVPVLMVLVPASSVTIVRAFSWSEEKSAGHRRHLLWSLPVFLVCWIGPLADAVLHGGGNLAILSRSTGGGPGSLGWRGVGALLINLFTIPPAQFADIDDSVFRRGLGLPAVLLGLLTVWIVVQGVRRGTSSNRSLLLVFGLALVAALIDASLLPNQPIENTQLTWFKVLVPFGVLSVVAAASGYAAAKRSSGERSSKVPSRVRVRMGPIVVGLLVVFASLPIPIHLYDPDGWIFEAEPRLRRELTAELPKEHRFRIRARGAVRYELLQHTLIADLDARGWTIGVTDRNRNYYGADRVFEPGPNTFDLMVQDAALGAPAPGALLVAGFRSSVDLAARHRVREDVQAWAAAHGPVQLTDEANKNLGETLLGRRGTTQAEVDAIRQDPSLLLKEPPELITSLYSNTWIASPELPEDLDSRLRTTLGPGADVWMFPSDG